MKIVKEIIKKIILVFLSIKVFLISKKIEVNKKNLFIDLGTNKGQGFRYFQKFFKLKNFDYLLVEPNPNLKGLIEKIIIKTNWKNKIQFINKAAHVKNSKKKLFGTIEDQRGKLSDGASIIEQHNSKMYNPNYSLAPTVETFDFVSKLLEFQDYDNIIIKMDVEGAEYDLLERLILNLDKIKNINHIFVEFHSRFMKSEDKTNFKIRENKIKKELKKKKLNFTNWI